MSLRWGHVTKFLLAVLVVVLCGVVGVGIGVANWLRKDLPSPTNLQTIAPPVKTLVYDRNEKLVHEFFKENRSLVPLREIPRPLVQAILAIEDRRFYSHWGIDPIRLARALLTDAGLAPVSLSDRACQRIVSKKILCFNGSKSPL